MKLYICRHADAVDRSAGAQSDEDRWLTAHGRSQAALVGRALRDGGDGPDLVLTSPLVRAVQTAEGLAHAAGYTQAIAVERALAPEGQLSDLLDRLAQVVAERVFVVGHEPQMGAWTAALVGRPHLMRPFEKGAVARIDWEGAPGLGTGTGAFYLAPGTRGREAI